MNPATRKNPLDNAKFRDTYLANLKLEASNNQRNQNANLIFKQTGAPPPVLPDNRTTTDKYADLEGLKVLLRGKLQGITDGTIASQIVGQLGEEQIKFAINAWDTIEKDMKTKFSLGVPAPVFIAYLNRLMETYENNDFVELGLSQSSNPSSYNQILYTLNRGDLLRGLVRLVEKAGTQFGVNTDDLVYNIKLQYLDYPSFKSRYDMLTEPEKENINQIIGNLLQTIVPDSDIPQMINSLDMVIQKNDRRAFPTLLEEINEQFQLTEAQKDMLGEIYSILQSRQIQQGLSPPLNPAQTVSQLLEEEVKQRGVEDLSVPSRQPTLNLPQGVVTQQDFESLKGADKKAIINKLFEENPTMVVEYTIKSNMAKYDETKKIGWSLKKSTSNQVIASSGYNGAELNEIYAKILEALQQQQPQQPVTGNGIHGKKSKMKGRGISHLVEKDYEKPKIYSQFGRYFINKPKLNSGIMALRLPSGNFVPNFPTQKLSLSLKEVLKMLVNGAQPTYEAISKMSDEDRDKLVDICQVCHVDMPSIPKSKNMDKDEQDDYRFEVLKGEIMAGNNSPVLVKEFKSLLLKLSRSGKIPKREAHEILEELATLGF